MPNSAAMKLRMSLFRHLEKLIELLGGPAPELVLKDSTPGKAKFVLSLDVSKIPRPTVSVLPTDQVLFSGDDPFCSEVAEHKAVMSVIKFLEENFSLEIHDLSFSKIKTVELNIVHVVSGINSFTNRFRSFIMQYESSINLLVPFLSSSTQDSVMNGICQSLSDLCNVSHSSIDRIKEQLNILDHEVTLYSRNDTGLMTLFFIRNFDGTKLVVLPTEINIDNFRSYLLYELMAIKDSSGTSPSSFVQIID